MCSKQNEVSPSEVEKEISIKKFLDQVTSVIEQFEKVDDASIQRAIRQLHDVKAHLYSENQVPRDWASIGKNLLLAAQWIKFIYDFFQE